MHIEITLADIDTGTKHNPHWCPIARAARRAGYCSVSVYENQLRIEKRRGFRGRRTTYRTYLLPPAIAAWISQFDAGQPVTPFTLDL